MTSSSQLQSKRGCMSDRISLEVYQHENRRVWVIVLRLSVQAPVPDDGLASLSEVNVLPVGSRLLLLLMPFLICPPNHVCVTSYLALCLAFVRDHVPRDHKEEECPHCLKLCN